MITNEKALEILKEAGSLWEGHFLLTSGKHSDKYLQCAKVFQNAKYSEFFCKELAEQFLNDKVDVVIGPALGAIQMAYEVSRQLGVPNFFAEREDGKLTLRRGFKIEEGMRALVVEDVVTTGGSVREVMDIVTQNGGICCGCRVNS
jgi:orotate phosphoribosyltransferase